MKTSEVKKLIKDVAKANISELRHKKFLFIGEERSEKAKSMNVQWRDGRLCAKQLFEALEYCGYDPEEQRFMNLFEPLNEQGILHNSHAYWIASAVCNDFKIVGMGKKVQRRLTELGITHIPIIHPAARGLIRIKRNYFRHIKKALA